MRFKVTPLEIKIVNEENFFYAENDFKYVDADTPQSAAVIGIAPYRKDTATWWAHAEAIPHEPDLFVVKHNPSYDHPRVRLIGYCCVEKVEE